MLYSRSNMRSGAPSIRPLVRIASLYSAGNKPIQFHTADSRCVAIARCASLLIFTINEESSAI